MRTENPVLTARTLAHLSRPQLAAMSGVAVTTIYRIESGCVSPSSETVNRILAAAGYVLENNLSSVSDPGAVAAARGILDPSSGLGAFEGAAIWIDRWKAAGFVIDTGSGLAPKSPPSLLARRAGLAARLASRPGLLSFRRREGRWLDIARRIDATGTRWAATGGTAANRLVPSADAPWPVFYVSDPDTVAKAADFAPRGETGPVLSLIPFDGVADVGIEVDDQGLRWVDPLQVLIDCYGGSDRMPEQAEALAAMFDGDHVRAETG